MDAVDKAWQVADRLIADAEHAEGLGLESLGRRLRDEATTVIMRAEYAN